MKNSLKFGLIGILMFSVFLALAGCYRPPVYPSGMTGTAIDGSYFESNGQRIYFTATSSSGQPITPQGYSMMMNNITCADCHGPAGHGGTVQFMMQSFDVPDITWPELTGQEHNEEGHEDHPPYTEQTLKQAITQGIEPDGSPFEYPMPRWQMSEQDLNDLVEFIKTLE